MNYCFIEHVFDDLTYLIPYDVPIHNATFDWLIHVFCYCTCDVCVLCCVSGLIAVVLLNRIGKFVTGKFFCCMVPVGEPPQYKVRFSDHLKTTTVQYYSVFSDIFRVMALICLVFG